MRAIVPGMLLLLSACAATPPQAPASTVCTPVRAYSLAEERALAAAVAALPPSSPLVGAMLDYGRLRAAARACAKA